MSALDKQIGGDHYKDFAIQPVEFIHRNQIGYLEGCAIKYLCRWKSKGGLIDLEKAKHYIELLMELSTNEPILAVDDILFINSKCVKCGRKAVTGCNGRCENHPEICKKCQHVVTKNDFFSMICKCKCHEERKDG